MTDMQPLDLSVHSGAAAPQQRRAPTATAPRPAAVVHVGNEACGAPVKKGREFFHRVQPTFTVTSSATPVQLCFLDESDPNKDTIVRRKAREWVWRNKNKQSEGKKKQGAIKGAKAKADKKGAESQVAMMQCIDWRRLYASPLMDVGKGRVDPFGVLPAVGRKTDHIIEYFLTACPEEVPGSDDHLAWRPPHGTVLEKRHNTVLGHMAGEHVSFVLWLHATTMLRDGIAGHWDSDELHYYYKLALMVMRDNVNRKVEDYTDSFLVALACFAACANFAGMFEASCLHHGAMVRAITLRGNGDTMAGLMSCSDWVRRAFAWCEFGTMAEQLTTPHLPYLSQLGTEPVPPSVIAKADILTRVTLLDLPPIAAHVHHIIRLMHQCAILLSGPETEYPVWGGRLEHPPASIQPLYDVEFALLNVLAATKDPAHCYTRVEVLLMQILQLFCWVGLRALPPAMKLCDPFLDRVKDALLPFLDNAPSVDGYATDYLVSSPGTIISSSSSSASPPTSGTAIPTTHDHIPVDNLVTWALFISTLVSSVHNRPVYGWFKGQFHAHTQNRGSIRTKIELEQVLRLFPYLEGFCGLGIKKMDFEFEAK